MPNKINTRLKEMDIIVPELNNPIANYLPYILIGNLAFIENNQYMDGVKIGVLTGSLLSTLVGYFLLLIFSKK